MKQPRAATERAFPPGFLWGTATSSHQVEGGNFNNDWSDWELGARHVAAGDRAGRACEWWAGRAEADLRLSRELGHGAHRLSLEWSRLEPEAGKFDAAAFDRYGQLLEHSRSLGMQAMVTLHHFTLPRWVARAGGWTEASTVQHFVRFAERAAAELGSLVDLWVTLNEPTVQVMQGFFAGVWPPGLRKPRLGMRALGNLLLAHARAYARLRTAGMKPVGIVVNAPLFEAARPAHVLDRGVERLQDFAFTGAVVRALATGWLLPPVSLLPRHSAEIASSLDFVGLNYYGRYAVRFTPSRPDMLFGSHVQTPTMRTEHSDWGAICGRGLTLQLVRLSQLGVPLYVTENGVRDADDLLRTAYLREHVAAVRDAIEQGADVRGYFHWSLLDNFEWAEGYQARFGLVGVDFETQTRTVRDSARAYAEICRRNAI
jgi:beta-glucosidase